MRKHTKIAVDILMLVAVVLSVVRWDGEPTFHVAAGVACALLFVAHFCLNRKVLLAYSKSMRRLKASTRFKYLIDMLLVITWSVVIVSGFIALMSHMEIIDPAFKVGRLHGIFARVGVGLIAVHIIQHSRQIISYFAKKA